MERRAPDRLGEEGAQALLLVRGQPVRVPLEPAQVLDDAAGELALEARSQLPYAVGAGPVCRDGVRCLVTAAPRAFGARGLL